MGRLCPATKRGNNTVGAIKITAGLDFNKRASAVDWLRGFVILSEAKDLCRVVLVSGQRFFTTLRSVQNDSLEVFYNLLIILRHKINFRQIFVLQTAGGDNISPAAFGLADCFLVVRLAPQVTAQARTTAILALALKGTAKKPIFGVLFQFIGFGLVEFATQGKERDFHKNVLYGKN